MSEAYPIDQSSQQPVLPLAERQQRNDKRALGYRVKRFLKDENNKGYLFISPWFIGFMLFQLVPMVTAVYNSFTNATLFKDGKWLGLQNYQRVLYQDKVFGAALNNMVLYLVLAIPLTIGLSLFIAVLLSRHFRGNHIFRSIIYAPTLVVGAAAGIMFRYVFGGKEVGIVNQFLALLGLPAIDWLQDSNHLWLAMIGLVILNIWFIGGTMIIFLAAIKNITPEYYEAARIDGASPGQLFRHITLPLITPTLVFNTIMAVINQMQIFDMPLVFAMGTASGFSTGGSVMGYKNNLATFMTYIYQTGFARGELGYASAMAMVVFCITLVLSIIVMWGSQRFTYYGDQEKG